MDDDAVGGTFSLWSQPLSWETVVGLIYASCIMQMGQSISKYTYVYWFSAEYIRITLEAE